MSTRDIARTAVRAGLAGVAFDLFRRDGFEKVTINDLAAAAGVSRSTFMRYFGSKEDAVLVAVDAQGEQIADAVRDRPADEDDWVALRHALDSVVVQHRQNPEGALAMSQLIMGTPALCARSAEKQKGWRPIIAEALAERADHARPASLGPLVRAAAAVEALNIAVDQWAASDGRLDLDELLDDAFAALAPR